MTRLPRILGRLGIRSVLTGAVLSLAAVGCAGDLDPALYATGTGATTGGGNTSGTGGSAGTGGTSGAPCDAPGTVFVANCYLSCHDSAAMSGLDLTADGMLAMRLLNKKPDPGTSQVCGTSTMPYLVQNSMPATGLLLDKLKANTSCGVPMPYPGITLLAPADVACVQSWANAVTTGAITP